MVVVGVVGSIGGFFVVLLIVGFSFGLVVGVAEAEARGERWERWQDGTAGGGV